jgi:hypothetical protein
VPEALVSKVSSHLEKVDLSRIPLGSGVGRIRRPEQRMRPDLGARYLTRSSVVKEQKTTGTLAVPTHQLSSKPQVCRKGFVVQASESGEPSSIESLKFTQTMLARRTCALFPTHPGVSRRERRTGSRPARHGATAISLAGLR